MFLRETTVELRALRAIAPGKTEIVGGQVVFLHEGRKHWEGSSAEILTTNNEELNNFIFASKFLKELKKSGG